MVFETKKINIETLGEYLTEVREQLKLSTADVSHRCGIKQQYVISLEAGFYKKLPPDVYVYGFLRQMAGVYNIDSVQLINQYKKERGIFNTVAYEEQNFLSVLKRIFKNLVVTPKLISVSVGLFFVAATIIYIVWQVASISKSPSLEILKPQNRQIVKEGVVAVEGRTDPGAILNINNQDVFVDGQGVFKTQVSIGRGPKDLIFSVHNKFDKSATQTVSVVGDADVGLVASASSTPPLVMKLQFLGHVSLSTVVDDSDRTNQDFQSGSSTVFTANRKIIISTSNAGATKLELNGKNLGLLGRSGEVLTDIPFVLDSISK